MGFASAGTATADVDVAAVMQIRNVASHKCLDGDSAGVRTQTCDGTDDQRWNVVDTGDYNRIVNVRTGRCLDGSTSAGVRLLACNGGANQRWDLTSRFVHPQSGRCLDGSVGLRLKTCNSSSYQSWSR
jgi:hypothetical protein